MRRKLMGVALGAIVAVSGFAVAGLGTGTAATSDTTTATTTGTTATTTGTTATTTGSTAATTTAAPPSTVTVTVTATATSLATTTVTDTETVFLNPKVSLCHRVGTRKRHHWVQIKVAPSAVNAHLRHGDRAIPRGGCRVYR